MRATLITDRDVAVLQDLLRYRYMTGAQIQAAHFPSVDMRNRRLRLLVKERLVRAFELTGINGRVFGLTKQGADWVASSWGVDELEETIPQRAPKDYFFMRHFIAITDFRMAIERACEGSVDIAFRGFIPEYTSTRKGRGFAIHIRETVPDIKLSGETISHIPDGVFCLEKKGKFALFMLEVDRGTERLSNPQQGVSKMIRFYLSYLKAGSFARYAEDFSSPPAKAFRTLIVTTTEKRAENMRAEAGRRFPLLQDRLSFIWITHRKICTEHSILGSIWSSLNPNDSNRYSIEQPKPRGDYGRKDTT